MEQVKMPDLLTPETINAMSANAEVLRNLISSGDERMALSQNGGCNDNRCCCPKFLKFKFVLCNVTIINNNAACQKDVCAAD